MAMRCFQRRNRLAILRIIKIALTYNIWLPLFVGLKVCFLWRDDFPMASLATDFVFTFYGVVQYGRTPIPIA